MVNYSSQCCDQNTGRDTDGYERNVTDINISSWLVWEKFIMQYLEYILKNIWGRVVLQLPLSSLYLMTLCPTYVTSYGGHHLPIWLRETAHFMIASQSGKWSYHILTPIMKWYSTLIPWLFQACHQEQDTLRTMWRQQSCYDGMDTSSLGDDGQLSVRFGFIMHSLIL